MRGAPRICIPAILIARGRRPVRLSSSPSPHDRRAFYQPFRVDGRWLVSLEIKMGGKKQTDPATGKRIRYPSDFKKKKPRATEQNAARRNERSDNSKVYFVGCSMRVLMMLFAEKQGA